MLEGRSHLAPKAAFCGSRRTRGEGSSRSGVSGCGWRRKRSAGRCLFECEGTSNRLVCSSVRDRQFTSRWPGFESWSAFPGLEINETIDNSVHQHDPVWGIVQRHLGVVLKSCIKVRLFPLRFVSALWRWMLRQWRFVKQTSAPPLPIPN